MADYGFLFIIIIGFLFTFAAIVDFFMFNPKKNKKTSLNKVANADNKIGKRVANHGTNVCQAADVKHPKIGTLGLEDRKNDWLAQQLRAEAKSKSQL